VILKGCASPDEPYGKVYLIKSTIRLIAYFVLLLFIYFNVVPFLKKK
jgi:hypothetical protein